MSHMALDQLPDPGNRYQLQDVIGCGVSGKVYKAIDTESDNRVVAIKIQKYEGDLKVHIEEEYRILRDYSTHPNLPDFFGVYRKKKSNSDEIWFILEYCAGGSIIDLVTKLRSSNRRFIEEHIAYVLRETAKAVTQLHKNYFIHRDIKGSNILLTNQGEVKLCDFGLARNIGNTMGKRGTAIGSPCWMAPEMVTSPIEGEERYGSRIDVWALGITAIELADGSAPFQDIHPTRAMFQIVRNPPPTLYRPANWTQTFNDFIAECLEKNADNRPFMQEIIEHPFFTEIPADDHHFTQELKHLIELTANTKIDSKEEISIIRHCMKKFDMKPEKMYVEDLAALEKLTEENIIEQLQYRMENGESYTFIGDVLISLNSNDLPKDFKKSIHNKYKFKSRSDNAPHILAVADSAYQDMMHHEEAQHIIFAGETFSGKTTNLRYCLQHLSILGEGHQGIPERLMKATEIVHSFTNGGTLLNPDSTRCASQIQVTFGSSGKLSGVIYWIYMLEKSRVSTTDLNQSNFHIFYYFYDAMEAMNRLNEFSLDANRSHRYLRVGGDQTKNKLKYVRDDPEGNVKKFKDIENHLLDLELSNEQIAEVYRILAAILVLGDVRYNEDGNKFAEIENPEVAQKVAALLKVDEKKFQWTLINYCVVKGGVAERRKHTCEEARDARDVLAATIYCRLVDYMINIINQKLAFSRAVYGDSNAITLTDMFGFECQLKNKFEQLVINCLNEQMQYHYNQRMFVWEMMEQEEEEVSMNRLHYYDNKSAVDQLMTKPHGLFYIIDDATRGRQSCEFITDAINNRRGQHLKRVSPHEFSVAHYTGKLTYDAREFENINRDFVPPEMMETLRSSTCEIVKLMFTNQLTKTGNLTMAYEDPLKDKLAKPTKKSKWGAVLVAEKHREKKINTLSQGQYSQVHKMRTICGVFRATCLEILKGLSTGGSSSNTHFVRCIRPNLEFRQRGFQTEMVYQQIRALSILDTAAARKTGFAERIQFSEFLRRYKFLAFDFDENVELTKDNCRLLLLRMKMEGWILGKTKVFLKYYNVEYLSRLYETQVKKIVKVQCMMRAFLAKRNMVTKLKIRQQSVQRSLSKQDSQGVTDPNDGQDEAAVKIQTAYRGFSARRKYGTLVNSRSGVIDQKTASFIQIYAKRWKEKSIFQVLLHYRAARYQDLVNIAQQIHIFNQHAVAALKESNKFVLFNDINRNEINPAILGTMKQPVRKLPFNIKDIPYFNTKFMCDNSAPQVFNHASSPSPDFLYHESEQEDWDAPFKERTKGYQPRHSNTSNQFSPNNTMSPPVRRKYKPPAPLPPEPIYSNVQEAMSSRYNDAEDSSYRRYDFSTNSNRKESPKHSQYNHSSNNASKFEVQMPYLRKRAPPPPPTAYSSETVPSNPVHEIQLMRQKLKEENQNQNDDDPPFDFRSMLRKTNYNHDPNKNSMTYSPPKRPEHSMDQNNNVKLKTVKGDKLNQEHQFNSNKDMHKRIEMNVINEEITNDSNANETKFSSQSIERSSMKRKSIKSNPSLGNKSKSISFDQSNGKYINEEIAPGIILEGYAMDF